METVRGFIKGALACLAPAADKPPQKTDFFDPRTGVASAPVPRQGPMGRGSALVPGPWTMDQSLQLLERLQDEGTPVVSALNQLRERNLLCRFRGEKMSPEEGAHFKELHRGMNATGDALTAVVGYGAPEAELPEVFVDEDEQEAVPEDPAAARQRLGAQRLADQLGGRFDPAGLQTKLSQETSQIVTDVPALETDSVNTVLAFQTAWPRTFEDQGRSQVDFRADGMPASAMNMMRGVQSCGRVQIADDVEVFAAPMSVGRDEAPLHLVFVQTPEGTDRAGRLAALRSSELLSGIDKAISCAPTESHYLVVPEFKSAQLTCGNQALLGAPDTGPQGQIARQVVGVEFGDGAGRGTNRGLAIAPHALTEGEKYFDGSRPFSYMVVLGVPDGDHPVQVVMCGQFNTPPESD